MDQTSSRTGHTHQSHPAIIKRLKRADGHLRGIIEMIEAGRPCAEIAQQLHAVEKAVSEAKKTLIRDHLDHCLGGTMQTLPEAQREAVAAFRDITRYL
ncbi:MAG: metal-sensing transcriptional repressor [Beijerinckiaceae bacterium]|nr:metal-sensing transcriptional repressor [Beijerinckiaceae bacterium]